jgi:hypothetical protein
MKVPCKECICLATCRAKARSANNANPLVIDCTIVYSYLDYFNKHERPMYRQTRVNKVRKALGLKKKGRGRFHER